MSLALMDAEFKKKFQETQALGGKSVYEHAANQLLSSTALVDKGKRTKNGEPIFERELEVIARTELPSPSGTALLLAYTEHYEAMLPFRKGKCLLRPLNNDFMTAMISKDRKSRQEYTQIATGAALNSSSSQDSDIMKKVATS